MNAPIHHVCEQNTEEWFKLRAGIPTASSFDKIVTPAKGEPSKQAEGYLHHLLAEALTGHVLEFQSEAMSRGHEFEDESRKAFELLTDIETQPSGFWTTADGTIGASPDGLIGEDGLLELKNPLAKNHIAFLLSKSVEREYWVQLQGQLWVTQRKYVKIVSYYPQLPLVIMHVEPDAEFQKKLSEHLPAFAKLLAETKAKLESEISHA